MDSEVEKDDEVFVYAAIKKEYVTVGGGSTGSRLYIGMPVFQLTKELFVGEAEARAFLGNSFVKWPADSSPNWQMVPKTEVDVDY